MNFCQSAISLLCFLLALSFSSVSAEVKGQEDPTLFTIYLVRHAEKQTAVSDPPLTTCGEERAVALQDFLSDIPIEAVYSTDFKRTQRTAAPVANAKGLNIQSYDPQALEALERVLMAKQQDALVIGHSNTTAVLAGMLIGEEMGAFDESIYNRIYQVVVSEKQQRLHVFHTAFECNE
jgi:broad specificity phosphatase PhoE